MKILIIFLEECNIFTAVPYVSVFGLAIFLPLLSLFMTMTFNHVLNLQILIELLCMNNMLGDLFLISLSYHTEFYDKNIIESI